MIGTLIRGRKSLRPKLVSEVDQPKRGFIYFEIASIMSGVMVLMRRAEEE